MEDQNRYEENGQEEKEESWLLAGAWSPEFGEQRKLYERAAGYVRRACCVAAVAVICLCVMKVGNDGVSDEESEPEVEENIIEEAIRELVQEMERRGFIESDVEGEASQEAVDTGKEIKTKDTAKKTLDINIVDEFPPESELELHIIGENSRSTNKETDSIFSQMTNLVDTDGDEIWLIQEDGSVDKEDGIAIWLNTAKFFVPDGGSRSFGIPNFSTEIYGEGEWEQRRELDEKDLIGDYSGDFNGGIDVTRQLVAEGYLNDEIARLLDRFPEIKPYERQYTLRLVNAGETLREEDQTRWWDVDYALYTEADNGEELMLVYIDITKVTVVDGEVCDWDDAQYRLDVALEYLWQLLEDPAKDKGEVWMQQIMDGSVADEAAINRFVEEYGAQIVVPRGADAEVEWKCYREECFYYDYLVWQGETADYAVTLAIPLMGKSDEGYYFASRIRKEAEDKETCHHILSGMMQTFQGVPYLHVVTEGESLAQIAEKYSGAQENYVQMQLYDEGDGSMRNFDDPDRIYPGQKVSLPFVGEYDGRDVKNFD